MYARHVAIISFVIFSRIQHASSAEALNISRTHTLRRDIINTTLCPIGQGVKHNVITKTYYCQACGSGYYSPEYGDKPCLPCSSNPHQNDTDIFNEMMKKYYCNDSNINIRNYIVYIIVIIIVCCCCTAASSAYVSS